MVVSAKSTEASITSIQLSQPPLPPSQRPRGAASLLVVHREPKDVCVYTDVKFMDALRVISIVAILINERTSKLYIISKHYC